MHDYTRLDAFLSTLAKDVYAEPPTEPHISITAQVIAGLSGDGIVAAGLKALDVGCGQGLALEHFARLKMDAVGITLGPDYDVCVAKGLNVRAMDQSFLDFADGTFDFLWCRHILEHSVFPLFTLSEYRRVLKPDAYAYVEVPAPDTACRHETNPNHYSVLGKSAWHSLFSRVPFAVVKEGDMQFETKAGPDTYWGFLLRRD